MGWLTSLRHKGPATLGLIFPSVFLDFLPGALIISPLVEFNNDAFGKETFVITAWRDCGQAFLSFLACAVIGTLSDKYGRSPVLFICSIGTLIPHVVLAATMNAWVYLYTLVFGALVGAGGGPSSAIFLVISAYVADIVGEEGRAAAFGQLIGVFGITYSIGPVAGAIISREFGMQTCFWVSVAIRVLHTLYVFFFVPESYNPNAPSVTLSLPASSSSVSAPNSAPVSASTSPIPSPRVDGETAVTVENSQPQIPPPAMSQEARNRRRRSTTLIHAGDMEQGMTFQPLDSITQSLRSIFFNRYLCVLASVTFLTAFADNGIREGLLTYLVRNLGFQQEDTGLLLSIFGVSCLLGQGVALPIMTKFMSEQAIVVLGAVFNCLHIFLFGVATTKLTVYGAVLLAAIAFLGPPAANSLVSRAVSPDEQGSIQGTFGSVKAITSGIAPLLLSYLFRDYDKLAPPFNFPGVAFVIASGLLFVALLLSVYLYFMKPVSWAEQQQNNSSSGRRVPINGRAFRTMTFDSSPRKTEPIPEETSDVADVPAVSSSSGFFASPDGSSSTSSSSATSSSSVELSKRSDLKSSLLAGDSLQSGVEETLVEVPLSARNN